VDPERVRQVPLGRRRPGRHGDVTPSVLAVADSDSYVKWAAATLETLSGYDATLVVLASPVHPTPAQLDAALVGTRLAGGTPATVRLRQLRRVLRGTPPDVLLVATTGPAAEHVLRAAAGSAARPITVTGLPGMSVPATELALRYRSSVDLFVVHSHREADEFRTLGRSLGIEPTVVVNRLPFLVREGGERRRADTAPLRRVVFAPQAKFPETRADRVRILHTLGRLADSHPDLDVVVKLRGLAGDAQTHHEDLPFDRLALEHRGAPGVAALRIATGPLSAYLEQGTALVTVSSTAVLEALALGLRALVLGDFGLGDHNLTGVYAGSGLVGSLDDLAAARMRAADPAWLRANYLHDEPDQLPAALDSLAGSVLPALRAPAPVGTWRGRVRRRMRLSAPGALSAVQSTLRAGRRVLPR